MVKLSNVVEVSLVNLKHINCTGSGGAFFIAGIAGVVDQSVSRLEK